MELELKHLPPFTKDNDYLNELTSKLMQDVQAKKEEIIKERLEEIGVVIDEEEEKKRRFKSMLCEIHGNEERWYYNDGNIEGIRVVTFFDKGKGPSDLETKRFHIGINIDYY